jgi:hypothetical protein
MPENDPGPYADHDPLTHEEQIAETQKRLGIRTPTDEEIEGLHVLGDGGQFGGRLEMLTEDKAGETVIVSFCPRCKKPLDQELYGPCKKCVEQLKGRAEERGAIIRKKLEERKARGNQSLTDLEADDSDEIDIGDLEG